MVQEYKVNFNMPLEDYIHPFLKYYTEAPQFVKTLAGSAYAYLPDSWRYGKEYHRFLADIESSYAYESLPALVDQRLRATLRWAADTVPAFRELGYSVGDAGEPAIALLRHFPLLNKEDIKAKPKSFLSDAMPASTHLLAHTGGSTSIPMRLYLHKFVSRSKDFAYNGTFDRVAGISPADRILALRGRTVPGADKEGGPIWMYDPIKRYLHLSSDHLEPEYMARYIGAIKRFKPTFIHAFPSAIVPLAHWLDIYPDVEITGRFKGIQLFSENVYPYQVELLERVFGCPVLLDYGHSERAVKAISLPGDKRYFFWPLYGYVELVDFSGRPIDKPGVLGEIVATGFDNKVMPLIRYRTGDLAMWTSEPNTIRPGFQVLDRVEGRLQEFLVCRDNRLVSIATIGAAHFEELATADRMQFEQTSPGIAILKVLAATEPSDRSKQALREGISKKTQGGLEIEVVRVDDIARTASGKHKLLVQHLDLSKFLGATQQDSE
ncbi:phenylacetate--CoA ligase family protein [Roseateles albus]|uniref:Phenylacetate--CoA ligase family protein n=1 Tax=Roseateles albus TaxID=2987525 RepID=A0ABT5KDT4_9BURK|nr:hypothetical protein [Roseateles albus]MDC8772085.1 hypothetical protein [Roseateles albus]